MTTNDETAHRTPHNGRSGETGANAAMGAGERARLAVVTAHTESDTWWSRHLEDLTPPTVWADKPASLQELTLYARHAAWTSQTGFLRGCGVAWCWLVAVPISTLAYYLAWLAQRPSRTLVVALLYAVIAHTGPGRWLLWWPTWLP